MCQNCWTARWIFGTSCTFVGKKFSLWVGRIENFSTHSLIHILKYILSLNSEALSSSLAHWENRFIKNWRKVIKKEIRELACGNAIMARVYYVFLFREDIKQNKQKNNEEMDETKNGRFLAKIKKEVKTNPETFSVFFFFFP